MTRLSLPSLVALLLTLAAAQVSAAVPNFGSFASISSKGQVGGEGSYSAHHSGSDRLVRGMASASLADGQLHAFSAASMVPCRGCGSYSGNQAGVQSRAMYWDTITFHNGRNLGLAEIELSVDGTLSPVGAQAWVRWYVGARPSDFFDRPDYYAEFQNLGTGTTVIDDGLVVPLGNRTVFVYAELVTSASSTLTWESAADFGNTLHFNWTLPEGVSYTSASGTFMTAAPVPEPASYALLLAGLGLIGVIARRRGSVRRDPQALA